MAVKSAEEYYHCTLDRSDPKWGRPELRDAWGTSTRNNTLKQLDETRDIEKKLGFIQNLENAFKQQKEEVLEEKYKEHGEWLEFDGKGCPEEPEASVHIFVRMPKEKKEETLRPVIFEIPGGGLVMNPTFCFNQEELSYEEDAVVVTPHYRTAVEARYPAAINDIHAAYIWMLEHAGELGIDTNRVVLAGLSSGGHLALSLAFRLKRYGILPTGIVAQDPVVEDRPINRAKRFFAGGWDESVSRKSAQLWLGPDLFGSAKVTPEAYPNRALVEDCVGYPPTIVQFMEFDDDSDSILEFMAKLQNADVFTEIHKWGGTCHGDMARFNQGVVFPSSETEQLAHDIFMHSIHYLLTNDMRRMWTNER